MLAGAARSSIGAHAAQKWYQLRIPVDWAALPALRSSSAATGADPFCSYHCPSTNLRPGMARTKRSTSQRIQTSPITTATTRERGFVMLQKCNVLEYGNSTCNQITYRPVGRPGDLVETVSPNTARERRPDPSYGQFACRNRRLRLECFGWRKNRRIPTRALSRREPVGKPGRNHVPFCRSTPWLVLKNIND